MQNWHLLWREKISGEVSSKSQMKTWKWDKVAANVNGQGAAKVSTMSHCVDLEAKEDGQFTIVLEVTFMYWSHYNIIKLEGALKEKGVLQKIAFLFIFQIKFRLSASYLKMMGVIDWLDKKPMTGKAEAYKGLGGPKWGAVFQMFSFFVAIICGCWIIERRKVWQNASK